MDEFSTPEGPDIPEVTELGDASPEQKAALSDLERLGPDGEVPADLAAERSEKPPEIRVDPAPSTHKDSPSIEERRDFLRCILGGKPYEKIYELFGGHIKATLRERGVLMDDRIYTQVTTDWNEGLIKTNGDQDLAIERYKLACTMVKLEFFGTDPQEFEIPDGAPAITDQSGNEVVASLREHTKNITQMKKGGASLHIALLGAIRRFENHMGIIVQEAQTSDFWKAAGPDSPSQPSSAD